MEPVPPVADVMQNMTALILTHMMASQTPDRIVAVDPPIELVAIPGHGRVRPFKIAKYEVTKAQFQGFIRETGYDGSDFPTSKSSEAFLSDWKQGAYPKGQGKHPVCNINWHHAKAFCAWLAKKSGLPVRLPTDAEWTLAASGKEGRKYPWGDAWDVKNCNSGTSDDGFSEAAPVGSFPKGRTPEGVYDMAGNIWEWSAEGHLRGGPWCMGPETVLCTAIAREDTARCDDKFGLRICVGAP